MSGEREEERSGNRTKKGKDQGIEPGSLDLWYDALAR